MTLSTPDHPFSSRLTQIGSAISRRIYPLSADAKVRVCALQLPLTPSVFPSWLAIVSMIALHRVDQHPKDSEAPCVRRFERWKGVFRTRVMSVILVCWNSPTQGTSPISHVVQGAATSFGRRFVKNKQIEGRSPGGAALFPNTRIALAVSFSPARANRPSVQHSTDANARSHPSPFPQWREQQRHRAGQRIQHHSLQEKYGARGARLQVKAAWLRVWFDLRGRKRAAICAKTLAQTLSPCPPTARRCMLRSPSALSSPLSSPALLSC